MNELARRRLQKQFEKMLSTGSGQVAVYLDPSKDGVVVPEYLADEPVVRLDFAHGFNLPVFDIDADGIYAVLSFSGSNFGCTVPWESVIAMAHPAGEQVAW